MLELADEDEVLSCEDKYYRLRRGQHRDVDKVFRLGPTRVTAANTDLKRVQHFNNQFDVAYHTCQIQINKLQEQKEKIKQTISTLRESIDAEDIIKMNDLNEQLHQV